MEVTASFLSSVIPKDLCRTSIPLSYLTTSVRSTDNAIHSVQFYSHVNAAWVAFENNVTTQWTFYDGSTPANGTLNSTSKSSIYSWYAIQAQWPHSLLMPFRFVYLQNPYEFAEEMDVPLCTCLQITGDTVSDLEDRGQFHLHDLIKHYRLSEF